MENINLNTEKNDLFATSRLYTDTECTIWKHDAKTVLKKPTGDVLKISRGRPSTAVRCVREND